MNTRDELRNAPTPSTPPDRSFVFLAAVIAAMGGLLFGYDTGVISGAELFFRKDFTLSTVALEIIVSGVLAGAVAGALAGGRLAAAIFGLGMLFLPESPRWLLRRGRRESARTTLARVRGTPDVARELLEIEQSLAHSEEKDRLSDLFAPSVRLALVVGIGLAIFQQITGINTVIYYAPVIIQSAGISSASGAILATAGIGVVNVLMTIVSMRLIDRTGRKPLLLTGIAGMVVTLGLLGLVFRISNHNGALAWLAVISMMAYVASFAISLGPIFWLLISEIYPLKIRNSAEGVAATFNWGSNLLITLTFLTLVEQFGPSATFWLYGASAIGAWIFSYYFVPETKGRTLEEIEEFWRTRSSAKRNPAVTTSSSRLS